jgi:lantibiotic modifying enzyme
VAGVDDVLAAVLATCRATEAARQRNRAGAAQVRPESAGLYVGLSSQIWCWLTLREFGIDTDDALARAIALATLLPESLEVSPEHDLLIGTAGAIVGLLRLAEVSGEGRWLELASSAGRRLAGAAVGHPNGGLCWHSPRSPLGIGGYAHGATGIGWALARLARATGDAEAAATAEGAFVFEETLYDAGQGGWRDARKLDEATTATAWCHGATGIGLASVDLLRLGAGGAVDHADVVRRAAASCWQDGLNWNHTLCHGDAGAWELLRDATALGLAPPEMTLGDIEAQLVASLTEHGPVVGIARNEFTPGLLPGIGGIAYQLLRMAPASDLPSLLVLG